MTWYAPNTWFAKSAPTSITPDATALPDTAWSWEVLNTLSEDYATLATPYCDNPVVRAAIEAMRRNATKAVLQVGRYDDDGGFEPIDHPLVDIWANPATGETDGSIIEHLYTGMLECGNAYAQLVDDKWSAMVADSGFGNAYQNDIDTDVNAKIMEIQPIPRVWVTTPKMGAAIGEIEYLPINGSDYGRHYSYILPYQRALHVKVGRSSYSAAFGRTPLDSVRAELALIKLVSIYETTILTRSGVPSYIISLLGPAAQSLSRETIGVLQSDFARSTSGKAVGRPFVHRGEMKLDTPGFSPKDLSIAELTEIAVARVCGVLGWSPMSLKQPDSQRTYSNLTEANKSSIRDAVMPFLEQLAACLTKAVQSMAWSYDGFTMGADKSLVVRFDMGQIEELAVDQEMVSRRAVSLVAAGIVTVNEARAMLGLADMEEPDDDESDTQDTTNEDDQNDTETEDTNDGDGIS